MNSLHVDSVIKSYGTRQVLTDIYVSCTKGEIIGLLGRNGSGKSTLLKIIFGSLSADAKFIRIGNQLITGLYDNRKLVNYLPQHSCMPNHLKVSTIISLFCDKRNAALVIANEHIKPLLNKRSKQLSGGEKRIVEIFMLIHSDAKYILIDEPFNGIDPLLKEEIKSLIRTHSATKGFIVTDHDYRNILDIATKILLLHDGGTKPIAKKEDLSYWGYAAENS